MRVLSLFSGAGGADQALEAAGFITAGLCEIEPHARAVLREHWPDVPLHGDVQQVDGRQYRGVDVVVGGSPCQDLSVAGKRAGLTEGSGTRSSLFHDQVRIWNESQAPYMIWENVKGAFSSSKGADFAAVLSAIVGRDVPLPRGGKWSKAGVVAGPTAVAAWRLLDLQHFGVPQRRERIVVLAARAGGVDPAEVLAVGQSVRGHPAPRFEAREGTAAHAVPRADGTGGVIPILEATSRQGKSAEGSVGIGKEGDPMFTLSTKQHGVFEVKAVNISDGRATLDDVMGTLDTDGASTTAIGNQTRGVVLTYDARGNGDGRIVNTMAGDHQNRVTDYTALVVGEQTPPRALAFKIRGGVEVDAAGKSAGKGYLGSEELAFTLGTAQDQHIHQPIADYALASGQANAEVTEGISPTLTNLHEAPITFAPGIPRRLMPIECERLMGWPDDWTRWGVNEKGVRYELADTPRYRLCGNGIGREWMEWIALRLMEAVTAAATPDALEAPLAELL